VCFLFLLARGNNVLEVAFDGMIALIRKEKYGKGMAGRDMFGLAESSFLGDTKLSPRFAHGQHSRCGSLDSRT
jgi:hypothetical protein